MLINQTETELNEKDRTIIYKFFSNNIESLVQIDLSSYEGIKKFGDIYESYVKNNNLNENNTAMLFLHEIRRDEYIYKNGGITKAFFDEENANKLYDFITNPTIKKWLIESTAVNESEKVKIK